MTTLIAWLGVDTHGPTSAYIASDSRLSNPCGTWDNCRKVFAARTRPELLGYCGSVMFPSQILGQLIDVIDLGLLDHATNANEKCEILEWHFKESFSNSATALSGQGFSIVYITRIGEFMPSTFHAFEWSWGSNAGWARSELPIPAKSGAIAVRGSGKNGLERWIDDWSTADPKVAGTSRLFFSALADSLASGIDAASGGPPQMVGAFRKGSAHTFGVIYQDRTTVAGLPIDGNALDHRLNWRNQLFEVCSGATRQRLSDAAVHIRPLSLRAVSAP